MLSDDVANPSEVAGFQVELLEHICRYLATVSQLEGDR